ncbi:MAG: 4a-hydroxytetrahydrobiopterin dehydratase [Candidatus Binataceae bacterium]
MATLSADQIAIRLASHPGWEFKDNAISKRFRFKDFMTGIAFVNRVAAIAEAADHHPDMLINYTRITFSCTTHSEDGVTDKDFRLAESIEAAFKSQVSQ